MGPDLGGIFGRHPGAVIEVKEDARIDPALAQCRWCARTRCAGCTRRWATEAGATSHVVAAALGHTSPAVTQAHYIQAGTTQRARTRRVAGKVGAALAIVPTPANDNPLVCANNVRAAGNR